MSKDANFFHGIVCDNQDPDGLGRIKVSLPELEGGADTQSDWLPVLTPFAGDSIGAFCLPELEDVVVVMFFDKELEKGVVLGSMYNQNIKPPVTEENSDADLNDDGNNSLHFVRSRSGLRIILDDTDGEEKIQLLSPDAKTRIEMLIGDELINIETDKDLSINAKGVISFDAEEIEFKAEKAFSLEAENIKQESSKDITIEGSNSISLEGQSIKLN
ncbi:MAG: rhs element Vgr protein [Spirochaetales bacterium]|nr:rhs element Vgr protein [Spirochaetales bacterium]